MVIKFLLLIVGFILLIGGADFLVKGASALAKRLNISDLIIGLTIVSIGTSAPELAVNIVASIEGNAGMAIGNIIGSNLFNILLIIGVISFIRPISIDRSLTKREIPFLLFVALLLFFLVADSFWGAQHSLLSRIDGVILLLLFFLFISYTFYRSREGRELTYSELEGEIKSYSIMAIILMLIGGAIALMAGGGMIVNNASLIALYFGVSDTVVGLTIVALGTSLPELATSVVAAVRGNSAIAIGNVVGSNIFNTLLILGVGSLISPLPFSLENIYDSVVNIGATTLLLIVAISSRKRGVTKWHGLLFTLLYLLYISIVIAR